MRAKMTLLVLAFLLVAVPALAQSPGTIELGMFYRYWLWGHETQLGDKGGFGARGGYFFLKNLEVEGAFSFARVSLSPDRTADVVPLTARVVWNYPATERISLLLGAGYTRMDYEGGASATDDGVNALAGVRIVASDLVSFRLEGTVDRLRRPFNPSAQTFVGDFGLQAGMSLMLGGVAKDSDHDGVPDKLDKCPDTPLGVKVDAAGCPIDSDHDGVPDYLDKCPDTPAGAKVDANGCPIDSDHDGVPDYMDKCPGTPDGVEVDASGCPIDSDHDGVPDYLDKCPGTPAGVKVDAAGCPLDSDHDGVPDYLDKCPDTPAGTKVDATGCPVAPVFAPGKKSLILEGVNFETGKADLTPDSRAILDKVAESLKAYPEIKVEVQGHTDNRGTKALNTKLSQARAEAVRDYLTSKGVVAAQLTAKGYGPSRPIADNKTDAGRAKNRRVELVKVD